jgi:hypothetical protein
MIRYIEDKIRVIDRNGPEASPDTFKLTSGDTFRTQTPIDAKQIESKISKRMTESIESLADIIKDYARKYRRLNDRMSDVEVKLFGATRDEKSKKGKKTSAAGKENTSINRGSIGPGKKSPNTSMNRGSIKGHTPPVKEAKKKAQKKQQSNSKQQSVERVLTNDRIQSNPVSNPYTNTTSEYQTYQNQGFGRNTFEEKLLQ